MNSTTERKLTGLCDCVSDNSLIDRSWQLKILCDKASVVGVKQVGINTTAGSQAGGREGGQGWQITCRLVGLCCSKNFLYSPKGYTFFGDVNVNICGRLFIEQRVCVWFCCMSCMSRNLLWYVCVVTLPVMCAVSFVSVLSWWKQTTWWCRWYPSWQCGWSSLCSWS